MHGNNQTIGGPIEIRHGLVDLGVGRNGPDTALQTGSGPLINATGGAGFDGLSVYQGGYIPSDNNIAVGPTRIMETVNAAFAIYDKSGTLLAGPTSLRALWTGLGGECAANNGGDTVVQYDRQADRWMMTQLGSLSNPYAECIAVSTSSDPAGTYNLYSYSFGSNLNDYPKFGVWPTATNSAYLATYNLFANGASFVGAEICAYDRAAMLAGATAVQICFTGISGASFLPVDLDGPNPPLDGTPAYFADLFGGSLGMYKLTPNFTTQTATLSSFSTIPVASYSPASSAVQPGTTEPLDSLSDRLMYRLAFRMFADHESMVVNHSVVAGSTAGVRWYELRAPVSTSGSFSIFQQGTFAPPDSNYRWMGSIAMDQSGDIGLGYSVSSSSTFPAVRYTGRTPADGAGTMETEASLREGAGSQTGYTRWGDYSSLRIDPADDCTFWYVNEFLPVTSSYGWYTHIGSFKFSSCGTATPDFTISANPTSITATKGGSAATSTITVTALNGYGGTVNLSYSNCPTGATCSILPGSVTGAGTATLSVTNNSVTPGTYPVGVTGTDASNSSLTHSTSVSVTAVSPDFSLSANPTTQTITQGGTASSTITLTTLNGYSGSVNLTASGCPATATCSLTSTPISGNGTQSTLNVTNTSSVTPNTYTITITGTDSANLSHQTTFRVTINSTAHDFTISVPGSLSVSRGRSGQLTVTTGVVGASTQVSLSVSGLPNRVQGSFSPNPVTSGQSSTLTINVNRKSPTGNFNVTVTGKDPTNTYTHNASFTLSIQ